MSKRCRSVRVRGLVSAMNQVRDRVRIGLSYEEKAELEALVQRILARTDAICRANQITPADLPSPSRQAYDYLRDIELDTPARTVGSRRPTARSVRIPGVLATCRTYHKWFQSATMSAEPGVDAYPDERRWAMDLTTDAAAIADLCAHADSSPAALPIRSRRGYQWMAFLGNPLNLRRHLHALAELVAVTARGSSTGPPPRTALFPASALYRSRRDQRALHIVVNEGFIDAPQPVLIALAELTLGDSSTEAVASVKAFAASEAFASVQRELEALTKVLPGEGVGLHHDLYRSFERVNHRYFSGRIGSPRMVWSRWPTSRKLGHYDPIRDIVQVNVGLDRADVPDYMIDYVVYHELLHKTLGTAIVEGRRQVHGRAFRSAERAFGARALARRFLSERGALGEL